MVGKNRVAHNKFCRYVDGAKPGAVLRGSANWTSTGVCTLNNSVVIENDDLASAYFDYWNRLVADNKAQGQPLGRADANSHAAMIDGAGGLSVG
jgi:hypothetical protein